MKNLITISLIAFTFSAFAEYATIATEHYADESGGGGGGGSYIQDTDGNKISADRTVLAKMDVLVGPDYTLLPTVYNTNRWEAVVEGGKKSIWWTGTLWECDGFEYDSTVVALDPPGAAATRIVVVQPSLPQIEFTRTRSAHEYGKVVTSVELTRQIVFDLCHPVDSVWIQYTIRDNPNTLFNGNGVSSTWNDITSTMDLRYQQFDSSKSVGTLKEETLPNIAGQVQIGRENSYCMNVFYASGVFWANFGSQQLTANSGDITETKDIRLNFDANRSSSVYQNGAKVQPLTTTIKLWRRVN